jgi:uncharacterized protein YuzE
MTSLIAKSTYDTEADAANIRLAKTDDRPTTARFPDRPIYLDFDSENRLVGIKVLYASEYLPHELLAKARDPRQRRHRSAPRVKNTRAGAVQSERRLVG